MVRHARKEFEKRLTFGERTADHLALFAGSWAFILIFSFVLVAWIIINTIRFGTHWDPYPYILLNLMLSCLAAMQAPVILMSQNRQEARDRLAADLDYEVNLKAEKEVADMQRDLDEIKQLIRELSSNSC
jgi:uncharacterized membrane protein